MKGWKKMTEELNKITKDRCICPNCGHTLLFNRPDKVICSWCKHYVFKNKKVEFEWRLKESINRNK